MRDRRHRQPQLARRTVGRRAGDPRQPLASTARPRSDAAGDRRGPQRAPGHDHRSAADIYDGARCPHRRRGPQVRPPPVHRDPTARQGAPECGLTMRQPDPHADERRGGRRGTRDVVLPCPPHAAPRVAQLRAGPSPSSRARSPPCRSSPGWGLVSLQKVAATSRRPGPRRPRDGPRLRTRNPGFGEHDSVQRLGPRVKMGADPVQE